MWINGRRPMVKDENREFLKKDRAMTKDKIHKRVSIDVAKYPKIYEPLKKSAETNFRTVEQQALFYIWSAVNIEKNGKG